MYWYLIKDQYEYGLWCEYGLWWFRYGLEINTDMAYIGLILELNNADLFEKSGVN